MIATTTTRNWIVNNLLGKALLEQGLRQDGGHLHQLFRHLRRKVHRALWDNVMWGSWARQ